MEFATDNTDLDGDYSMFIPKRVMVNQTLVIIDGKVYPSWLATKETMKKRLDEVFDEALLSVDSN